MTNEEKEPVREPELLAVAKSTLDKAVDDMDEGILARLKAARRQAIHAEKPVNGFTKWFTPGHWMIPASGFAMTGLVAVLVTSLWSDKSSDDFLAGPALEDIQILSSTDDMELYEELEFYQWLLIEKSS